MHQHNLIGLPTVPGMTWLTLSTDVHAPLLLEGDRIGVFSEVEPRVGDFVLRGGNCVRPYQFSLPPAFGHHPSRGYTSRRAHGLVHNLSTRCLMKRAKPIFMRGRIQTTTRRWPDSSLDGRYRGSELPVRYTRHLTLHRPPKRKVLGTICLVVRTEAVAGIGSHCTTMTSLREVFGS